MTVTVWERKTAVASEERFSSVSHSDLLTNSQRKALTQVSSEKGDVYKATLGINSHQELCEQCESLQFRCRDLAQHAVMANRVRFPCIDMQATKVLMVLPT